MIYEINPRKTALLIIDAQREYSSPERPLFTPDAIETISRINDVSMVCRESRVPVLIIMHVNDALARDVGRMADFSSDEVFVGGSKYIEVDPRLTIQDSDIIIEKTRYSAFVNSNLESYLKTAQVDTLIITGFMTGYCSDSTARHAHDLDYKVLFIDDANSGPAFGDLGFGEISVGEIKHVVATLLAGGIAEVISADEIIQRIVGGDYGGSTAH